MKCDIEHQKQRRKWNQMLNIKSNGFESENDSKYHQVMGTSNVAEQENVNFIIKKGSFFG
jgi:hypothetical protein